MKQIPNFYNTALLYEYLQNHNLLLVQQSKHLSILTDVLYKKEPSLCINLLFLALSFFFFFFIEYIHGWCYLLLINLLLHLLSLFPYGAVRWRSRSRGVRALLLQQGGSSGSGSNSPVLACGWASVCFSFTSPADFGGSYIATAGACQLLGFEKRVWLIPSQRKTCQLLWKETWDCFKGVCFGSVSPVTREKNPCSRENERNYSISHLGTVHGKWNSIVISAEQTSRCIVWLEHPCVCVMLGAGLLSMLAVLGSFSVFQCAHCSTKAGGFAQGSVPAGVRWSASSWLLRN